MGSRISEQSLLLFRKFRIILNIIFWVVAVLTGIYNFTEIPYKQVLNSFTPQFFYKLTLLCLYFSWYWGSNLDINQKEIILFTDNLKFKQIIINIIIIVILNMFFLLIYKIDFDYMPILMIIFLILDWFGWLYYIKITLKKLFNESILEFKDNQKNLLRIDFLKNYISGDWQHIKIIINIVCYILIIIIAKFFPEFFNQLKISFVIFLMIIISEIITWYKRIELKIRVDTLDLIDKLTIKADVLTLKVIPDSLE
jgi:hypothetical protein